MHKCHSAAAGGVALLLAMAVPDTGGASQSVPGERQIAAQPDTKSFLGVSESVWSCVRSNSRKEHGTTYEPAGARRGRSTTEKWVGDIVLDFSFDPQAKKITYGIVDKPWVVAESAIWHGIQEAIERCR